MLCPLLQRDISWSDLRSTSISYPDNTEGWVTRIVFQAKPDRFGNAGQPDRALSSHGESPRQQAQSYTICAAIRPADRLPVVIDRSAAKELVAGMHRAD